MNRRGLLKAAFWVGLGPAAALQWWEAYRSVGIRASQITADKITASMIVSGDIIVTGHLWSGEATAHAAIA